MGCIVYTQIGQRAPLLSTSCEEWEAGGYRWPSLSPRPGSHVVMVASACRAGNPPTLVSAVFLPSYTSG